MGVRRRLVATVAGIAITLGLWDGVQELAQRNDISFIDETRVELNDHYHFMLGKRKPYPKVIQETRYRTRVYVFLGVYNALVDFLRDLHSEGVTSEGEHVVIAVVNEKDIARQDFFLRVDERSVQNVTRAHLDAFRNVLLMNPLKRTESAPAIDEDFRRKVFQRNYAPPINLPRGLNFTHFLRQESVHLYDAVMHYGHTVIDLINKGDDPYNASLVIQSMRNTTFRSMLGFDVPINAKGESEGRYEVLSLAYDGQRPLADMWPVGKFHIGDGDPEYETVRPVTWVKGRPISDPECGFDGSKCGRGEQSEWKIVAIGIGVGVVVLLAIGGFLMALRYWLIVRRMRRQALAAEHAVCSNSLLELQEHDREGLLVC